MDYQVVWSPEAFEDVDSISYRLIYRVQDNRITIAAVIHGKRLLDPVVNRITQS